MAADRDYGPAYGRAQEAEDAAARSASPSTTPSRASISRVKTNMVKRTFGLLLQANRAGGKIETLLDIIQSDANDLFLLEKERNSSIRPVRRHHLHRIRGVPCGLRSSGRQLLHQRPQHTASTTTTSTAFGGGLSGLTLPAVKDLFLQMALIEAIFGGFGAGKLGEGSFSGGFKHVLIMAGITVAVFVLLVHG